MEIEYDFFRRAIIRKTKSGKDYTVKEFHGRVFKHEGKSERSPKYTGGINICGEYWNCALFENPDGSFNIVPSMPKEGSKLLGDISKIQQEPEQSNDDGDDIPF